MVQPNLNCHAVAGMSWIFWNEELVTVTGVQFSLPIQNNSHHKELNVEILKRKPQQLDNPSTELAQRVLLWSELQRFWPWFSCFCYFVFYCTLQLCHPCKYVHTLHIWGPQRRCIHTYDKIVLATSRGG